MPDHTTITNLGAVKAQSIAYDNTKAAIAIPQVSTADTFTTLNATQTLTNKTLTTPVIASLKHSSTGGTILIPTVVSGQTKELATLSDITTATSNMVTTDTPQTITGTKSFDGGMSIDASTAAKAVDIDVGGGRDNYFAFTRTVPDLENEGQTKTVHAVAPRFENNTVIATMENLNDVAYCYDSQTLANKTLTTPVIASLKQASDGGTINMPTVASGQTKTLATTTDIPTLPNNLLTTDTTQTITGEKTFTRTFTNSKGDTLSSVLHIPEHTYDNDYIVTTQYEQTLYNKEIVDPILPVFRKSEFGGAIVAPDVQAGSSTTLATLLDIPDTSNMVNLNRSQAITGQKTFEVSPVIASLKQSSTGGTINMPTVASGSTATLATTSDITTATSNMVTTNTTQTITGEKIFNERLILNGGVLIDTTTSNTSTVNIDLGTSNKFGFARTIVDPNNEESTTSVSLRVPSFTHDAQIATTDDTIKIEIILGKLITYLQSWANVGNLNMSDIVSEVDPDNYLGLQADPS